ncbi:MAG TPA: hypothetical protein VKQ06_10085 [Gammaproteobacteria bacterium]|nr:hypothetical protein [Gammaproteobacteria bacterium]
MASVTSLAIAWVDAAQQRWKSVGLLGLAEARLAAMGLAAMVFFAAAAAMLAFTAWALLNTLLVLTLSRAGVSLLTIFSALAGVHLAFAYLAWRQTLQLTRHIELPVTRRLLRESIAADVHN